VTQKSEALVALCKSYKSTSEKKTRDDTFIAIVGKILKSEESQPKSPAVRVIPSTHKKISTGSS
jgi:hypothetical protein